MATQLNRVELIGHLGDDPEARQVGSSSMTRLRVATTRSWRNKKTNEIEKETEWHTVTCWGQVAENAAKYLRKGRYVRVIGRIRQSEYEKDGIKRYAFEIVATEPIGFLDKGQDSAPRGGASPDPTPPEGMDDDIPF